MASGWNLWVWLESMGVVIIIITFPYSTCISSFLGQQHPYFLVHFLNVFSFLFVIFLKYIANVAQRTFEIVQKSRSADNIIINYKLSIIKNVERMSTACTSASPETSTCEVPVTF